MFLVYWIAMVAVGAPATDWANDGVFGDGWHLLGIGSSAYNDSELTTYTARALRPWTRSSAPRSMSRPTTSTQALLLAEMKDFQPTDNDRDHRCRG